MGEYQHSPEKTETRETIMEQAQQERYQFMNELLGLRAAGLRKLLFSKNMDTGLNLIPGMDIAKLTAEAVQGETLSGKKLSAKERLTFAAVAGSLIIAYTFMTAGMSIEAGIARGTSAGLFTYQFGPEMFSSTAKIAREKFQDAANARLLEAMHGLTERLNLASVIPKVAAGLKNNANRA